MFYITKFVLHKLYILLIQLFSDILKYCGYLYYYFDFIHHDVNGLYVFICMCYYVPCKEGAESPCHRLMSRLIS